MTLMITGIKILMIIKINKSFNLINLKLKKIQINRIIKS